MGAGAARTIAAAPTAWGSARRIRESIFGNPIRIAGSVAALTLFSEGWRQPWTPSPNGSGGAPRQGWINAADGNMYRPVVFHVRRRLQPSSAGQRLPRGLHVADAVQPATDVDHEYSVLDAQQHLRRPCRPSIRKGNVASTRGQTTFGDVSFTPRVLLHETQDFSVTFDFTILTPTGQQPLAGKTAVTPTLAFWYNLAGGWVVRGGVGDFVTTDGSGANSIISQLAIGQIRSPSMTCRSLATLRTTSPRSPTAPSTAAARRRASR